MNGHHGWMLQGRGKPVLCFPPFLFPVFWIFCLLLVLLHGNVFGDGILQESHPSGIHEPYVRKERVDGTVMGSASTHLDLSEDRDERYGRKGPFPYDLRFHLEVRGTITLLAKTRYYRSEDLHLKLAAIPGTDGWYFHSLELEAGKDSVNFGIGEGPNKHQRYMLFSSPPSEEERSIALEEVLRSERVRGCMVADRGCAEGPSKKALNNYYLWKNERGGFQFVLSPLGKVLHATNHTEVAVILKEGGRRSKPRFFNTLKYSLIAVPAFAGSFLHAIGTDEPVQWEMDCREIYLGISNLVRHVYGRKMTILDPESLEKEKIPYKGYLVPGTSILRIRSDSGPFSHTPIRVSGFKGELWVEAYKRETYLDMVQKRVIKDVLEISFGTNRKTKILRISGHKNIVKISLVDTCFLHCVETDRAILNTIRKCTSEQSDR